MSGPEYLEYRSTSRPFSLAFSASSASSSHSKTSYSNPSLAPFPTDLKLCIGSYSENASDNNITVVGINPQLAQDPDSFLSYSQNEGYDFVPLAKQSTPYPVTKVGFSPASLANKLAGGSSGGEMREMIATTSDCLRLWDLVPSDSRSGYAGQGQMSYRLIERSTLSNAKGEYSAPLTSFDWSTVDPSTIVTSSIDTTCTIWDISTNQAVTQLISHDREVFDVAWSPASKDVFASVGADGSVRSFDLRHLDHSTILFESSSTSSAGRARGAALLRLAYNPNDPNSVAVIHADSPQITILDVRSPGIAVAELQSHSASVNGIAWCGGSTAEYDNGMLASVGDDAQVMLWDMLRPNAQTQAKQTLPRPIGLPNAVYTAPSEINAVAWGGGRDYLAVAMGNGAVRCLRV